MIIGIDAGALSIRDNRLKVGVYRITRALIRVFAADSSVEKIRTYGFIRGDSEKLSTKQEDVILSPAFGYQAVRLPIDLSMHHVDCFIAASQSVPLICNTKILGCIYDISFLKDEKSYPESYMALKRQTARVIDTSGHILTISESVKKDILEYYSVDESKITVCYPPVEDVFYKKEGVKKPSQKYFIFVGALKRGKQIPMLIKAYYMYRKIVKDPLNLILVGGDYWKDPLIQSSIESYKVGEYVTKTGVVSDNSLRLLYSGARALISLSPNEGFCLPVIEAQSQGIPVIGVSAGAMPESVGNGGILVPFANENMLVEAMVQITEKDAVWKVLSKKALVNAQQFNFIRWKTSVTKALHKAIA